MCWILHHLYFENELYTLYIVQLNESNARTV